MKVQIKTMKFVFLFFSIVFLASCQTTGVTISDAMLSVKQTRIAVVAAIGEPRTLSENGREITSQYHDKNLKYLEITPKVNVRRYTKVIILGSRRPYDISVEVHIEQKNPETKSFLDIGLDEQLALKQANNIQEMLNQSREKNQAIDEGAPF